MEDGLEDVLHSYRLMKETSVIIAVFRLKHSSLRKEHSGEEVYDPKNTFPTCNLFSSLKFDLYYLLSLTTKTSLKSSCVFIIHKF